MMIKFKKWSSEQNNQKIKYEIVNEYHYIQTKYDYTLWRVIIYLVLDIRSWHPPDFYELLYFISNYCRAILPTIVG